LLKDNDLYIARILFAMKKRISSIDTVRGLIMIIMTLDHVRDFLHYPGNPPLNMATTTGILFFTRWITHFCAPTFVFLAGISANLAGQRRSKQQLSLFLLKRGAWLILSDLLIISLIFTFDPGYHVLVLEVLTATGFGMIILALLVWAPLWVIAVAGLSIIFGHNLLDHVQVDPKTVPGGLLTVFLTARGSIFPLGGHRTIAVLYPFLPWAGALLMGYVFGNLYRIDFNIQRRQRILLLSGLSLIILFIVLRSVNHYGDPSPWTNQRNGTVTVLSFLNATKQPPSLLFLCMTLGPVLVLLSFAERFKSSIWAVCRVYGNVPYFYFILHLCVIRILNVLLILIEGLPFKFTGFPLVWNAEGLGYPLWAVYLFWLLILVTLYTPCRWYAQYKKTHSTWWLSYL